MAVVAEPKAQTLATLDLDHVRIDPTWALRVPAAYALRKRVLPLCKLDDAVIVACARSIDSQTPTALRSYLKCDFTLVEVNLESLRRALARVYDSPSMNGAEAYALENFEAKAMMR